MDYTKLPKDLIYQDRKMLDDFMHNQITEKLVGNMLDINVLQISEFEKHALDCLNTAYYICTMAQVESKPEWRFGEYCDISLQLNQYYKVEYQRVVLSLVIILLECCNPEVISHSQVLIDKLRAFVTRGGNSTVGIFAGSLGTPILALREIFPRLYQGIDHAIIFPDNEFSPRNLVKAVSEDGMELSGRLYQAADICTAVTHFCKTNEEKKVVLNEAIKHGFVRMGEVTYDFSKWPEAEYNKLLSLLEKVDNDDTGKEKEQKETAKEPESDYYKEQFEKLKNEYERLRADFEKYKNDMSITKEEFDEIFPPNDNQQKKEEPVNTDNSPLLARITDLENEVEKYRTLYEVADNQLKRFQDEEETCVDLNEEQKLGINERIIFVSSLLGVSLKPDIVNQIQLAKLIAKLTGDSWESIRSRISSINSETQQVDDGKLEKFSEGTQTAAKNVYKLIDKAVKGSTRANKGYQCRQALENINLTYKLGIDL